MDGINPHFTVRISFSFLLLTLLQTSTEAQQLCSAPVLVRIAENNKIGDVVVTITAEADVNITFTPPVDTNNTFRLEGHDLIAGVVFDFETQTGYSTKVTCTGPSGNTLPLSINVIVTNVNEHPPVFELNIYNASVNEMSPVNTVVGRFPASDGDGDQLNYRLTPESGAFKLRSLTNPEILVQTPLDYETVKKVELILYVQDTLPVLLSSKIVSTASTTIVVTILDVDNRPPWFQPCTKYEIGGTVMCQGSGYTGSVVLNETEPGMLLLEPGPLYAIDGDSGINATISYSFVSGNEDSLFLINPTTGNITMPKPATVLKTHLLTVMAAQTMNSYQFATTSLTISVQRKNLHPPRFQKALYDGVVTGVGVKATDSKNKDEPLLIIATDEDYAATGGLNPHITYHIEGSSDFSIVSNYLFMTKEVPEAILALKVLAIDASNGQSATAQLSVQVTSGPTTTVPLSTTDSTAETTIGETTTSSETTENTRSTTMPSTSTDSSVSSTITIMTSESIITTTDSVTPTDISVSTITPSLTSESIITTTDSVTPTDISVSTITPSLTSEGSTSSASTTHPLTGSATTREPLSTTDDTATTSSKTTEDIGSTTKPSMSTESSVSSTLPSITSDIITTTNTVTSIAGGVSTITPSLTSEGSVSTSSTVHPNTAGGYRLTDMAALGASLGVLLFICLAVIGVLLFRMRQGKADWKKIYETSMFRSSLGQGSGGQKDVIQYTNDAFQNDEDGDSLGPGGPERGRVIVGGEPQKAGGDILLYESIAKSSEPLHDLLRDDTSQDGSDQDDSEKRVKPILTRERRLDEGYKSVWFKEDIDPNAKQEVVIIPDRRENDSEEEDNLEIKNPKVVFNDADLDSGLGVKIDDPAEDSENEEL